MSSTSLPEIIACYERVSTQAQEEAQTVQSQITLADAWVTAQGHTPEHYTDDGITGMLELHERPQGSRLLADAAAGKFTRVVVYKLDRLGRGDDARLILDAVYTLRDMGVQVVSLTEMIDTSTPAGELMLTMMAGFASYDRKVFLERSRLGTDRCARLGRWLGGIVPYGYLVIDGYLSINDEPIPGHTMSEAAVIRLLYHLAGVEGMACQRIADRFNALQIPPRYVIDGRKVKSAGKRKEHTSGKWTAGRIRNTIVEPVYRGEHHYGRRSKKQREVIIREAPAIVSPELWDAAQQTLHRNLIDATRNARRSYLLRGLVICGVCGRHYAGTQYKSEPYYVCCGKQLPKDERCHSKNVKARLEEDIWQQCVRRITHSTIAVVKQARKEHRKQATPASVSPADIDKAVAHNAAARQRIISALRRGILSEDEADGELQQLARERESLETARQTGAQRQQEREREEESVRAVVDRLAAMRARLHDDMSFADRRGIITDLIERITIRTIGEGSGRWHVTAEIVIDWRL